jgi:hypothetical protein
MEDGKACREEASIVAGGIGGRATARQGREGGREGGREK